MDNTHFTIDLLHGVRWRSITILNHFCNARLRRHFVTPSPAIENRE